jgi:hypothetical protein
MAIDLADYELKARESVKAFWGNREAARKKQIDSGRLDQGERSAVTAGRNMDGFVALILDLVAANGLDATVIHRNTRALTLPGFFRPTKLWDLLVINEGKLVAALEFKSQVGPSFGNNFNNRTEEAIGTAVDFWTAFREGAFGNIARPFLGWMMLLEDSERSRRPVRDASPHFPVFPEFRNACYAERYKVLCEKLIRENLYTVASVLVSPKEAVQDGTFRVMSEATSLKSFVTSFAAHIAGEAARAA